MASSSSNTYVQSNVNTAPKNFAERFVQYIVQKYDWDEHFVNNWATTIANPQDSELLFDENKFVEQFVKIMDSNPVSSLSFIDSHTEHSLPPLGPLKGDKRHFLKPHGYLAFCKGQKNYAFAREYSKTGAASPSFKSMYKLETDDPDQLVPQSICFTFELKSFDRDAIIAEVAKASKAVEDEKERVDVDVEDVTAKLSHMELDPKTLQVLDAALPRSEDKGQLIDYLNCLLHHNTDLRLACGALLTPRHMVVMVARRCFKHEGLSTTQAIEYSEHSLCISDQKPIEMSMAIPRFLQNLTRFQPSLLQFGLNGPVEINAVSYDFFATGILGHGRSSTVLRAQLLRLGNLVHQEVAVKIFHPDFGQSVESCFQEARNERAVMTTLKSVPVSASYEVQKALNNPIDSSLLPLLVFQHIGLPINPTDYTMWLHDTVVFLEILHATARIFHRDIRPSNLRYIPGGPDTPPKILVIDFGLAIIRDDPPVPWAGGLCTASEDVLQHVADSAVCASPSPFSYAVSHDLISLVRSAMMVIHDSKYGDMFCPARDLLNEATLQSVFLAWNMARNQSDTWKSLLKHAQSGEHAKLKEASKDDYAKLLQERPFPCRESPNQASSSNS